MTGVKILLPLDVEEDASPCIEVEGADDARRRVMLASFVGVASLGVAACSLVWMLLEGEATERADRVLESLATGYRELLTEQRAGLLGVGQVLAEDARVRSTLSVAEIDEGTIADVLSDLRKGVALPLLGALDSFGRVRAIAGPDQLRGADLGSTTVVGRARDTDVASAELWTLKGLALTVTVTPIRLASGARAYLLLGGALPVAPLQHASAAFGVDAALLIGDSAAFATGSLGTAAGLSAVLEGRPSVQGRRARVDVLSEGPTPIRLLWLGAPLAPWSAPHVVVLLAPLVVGLLGLLAGWWWVRLRASRGRA